MIVNGLLNIVSGVINLLLAPLELINFAVDVGTSLGVVKGFISVIAYLFPWSQVTPLIYIVITFFIFRCVVALIKTIWDLLPVL